MLLLRGGMGIGISGIGLGDGVGNGVLGAGR
jgi:hypothetical protein